MHHNKKHPSELSHKNIKSKAKKMLALFPEIFDEDEKPLINIDYEADLTHEDVAKILALILRRAVLDASGYDKIDNFLTNTEKEQARIYLTQGYIKKHGYYYYDETQIKHTAKRNSEAQGEKFQPTIELQFSPIPLNHILDYFNIDHEAFYPYINKWKENNWSRDNVWYKKFIKATNEI